MAKSYLLSGDKIEDFVKMDNREEVLGFVPQKETPYNKLLPYGGRLDVESREQVAQIKAWLGRTVQLRDIKIGASHWTGQLSKYVDNETALLHDSPHFSM